MIFRPRDIDLWDTTLVRFDTVYHLFHLAGGARLGHASSHDLVHWERRPDIPIDPVAGGWLDDQFLTGDVGRHEGRYFMFGGGLNAERESVYGLFWSDDLDHWEPDSANPVMMADGEIYFKGCSPLHEMHGAWRDPKIHRAADGWYHALVCARRTHWDHTTTGAVVGRLRSRDLRNWEHLPPLADVGDRRMYAEVPGGFTINGRHYLHFLDLAWGGAHLHTPSRDDAAGTFYVWSEDAEGPYRWPEDPLLLGACENRMRLWATRVFDHEDGPLAYCHVAGTKPAFVLPKRIRERAPGVLECVVCDDLVAKLVRERRVVDPTPDIRVLRREDAGVWNSPESGAVVGEARALGSSARVADRMQDLQVEVTVTMETGAVAGLAIRADTGEPEDMIAGHGILCQLALLDFERQAIFVRRGSHMMGLGWGASFFDVMRGPKEGDERETVRRPLTRGQPYRLRLLAREAYYELYLDDIWIATLENRNIPLAGAVELVVERGRARFEQLVLSELEPFAAL